MVRFRENLGRGGEIVSGRVSLSDMPDWLDALTEKPGVFSQAELQSFFEAHLATKIVDCVQRGLGQAQCSKEVIDEAMSSDVKLSKDGIEYLKSAVIRSYQEIEKDN